MSEAKPVVLNVTGMTCQGCVNSVTRIVKRADPAAEVAIDLPTGRLEATTAASAQTQLVFDNIEALLAAADMDLSNLVKLVIYCAEPGGAGVVRAIRNQRLGDHAPASTFVYVAGLANPDYLVEIEGEAVSEV